MPLIRTFCELISPKCARILFLETQRVHELLRTSRGGVAARAGGTPRGGSGTRIRASPSSAVGAVALRTGTTGRVTANRPVNGGGSTPTSTSCRGLLRAEAERPHQPRQAVSVQRRTVVRSVTSAGWLPTRRGLAVDRTRVTAGSVVIGGPYPMRTAREALVVVSLAPEGGRHPALAGVVGGDFQAVEAPGPGPAGPTVTWAWCRAHQGAIVARSPEGSIRPRGATAACASEEPP